MVVGAAVLFLRWTRYSHIHDPSFSESEGGVLHHARLGCGGRWYIYNAVVPEYLFRGAAVVTASISLVKGDCGLSSLVSSAVRD